MLEWVKHHWLFTTLVCIGLSLFLIDHLIVFVSARLGHPLHPQIPKRIFAGLSLVLITLTYFTVVALTALGFKALGRRLLPHPEKNPGAESYWRKREKIEPTLDYLKKQF